MNAEDEITEEEPEANNLNGQTYTIETQTPKYDLSWWIKWFAAITGIISVFLTSALITPWNLVVGITSVISWVVVGMLWNDRALMLMNAVMASVYLFGFMVQSGLTNLGQ